MTSIGSRAPGRTSSVGSRAPGGASKSLLAGCLAGAALIGCGGSAQVKVENTEQLNAARAAGRSKPMVGVVEGETISPERCSGTQPRQETSEYDTSGDDLPDVRKVFLRVGEGTLARLVLICRESDLNADGAKDIVRYYSDEGRPLREEADRNFDGQMDQVTIFQEGQILRQEFDSGNDGKVDTKIFFDNGRPLRAERDLKARSTADKWQPDRWEYFEEGRVIRMGTDVDGDGTVDRWDRDMSLRRGVDLPEAQDPDPA